MVVIADFSMNGVLLVFFISMCIYHQAFYEIFENLIDKWDSHDASPDDERFICDLIRFYVSIKE